MSSVRASVGSTVTESILRQHRQIAMTAQTQEDLLAEHLEQQKIHVTYLLSLSFVCVCVCFGEGGRIEMLRFRVFILFLFYI